MSPDEYIERINIRNRLSDYEIREYKKRALNAGARGIRYYPPFSEKNKERLKKAMLKGNEMEIPWVEYEDFRLREQEGFHRAMACKDLGIKRMPVAVYGYLPSLWKKAPHSIYKEVKK